MGPNPKDLFSNQEHLRHKQNETKRHVPMLQNQNICLVWIAQLKVSGNIREHNRILSQI